MGLPDAGERAYSGGRLLYRHHRGHYHPGADSAAYRAETGYRSHSLRPGHDLEPDDRPVAPAPGHGAVCAGARGAAVRGAHHHGDSAVAGSTLPGPDRDHLRAANYLVAAARARHGYQIGFDETETVRN